MTAAQKLACTRQLTPLGVLLFDGHLGRRLRLFKQSNANGGNGLGGAIFLGQPDGGPSSSSLTATDILLTLNVAVGGTGGSGANGGNGLGGGFYATDGAAACLQQSMIAFNSAVGGKKGYGGSDGLGIGGGVYVESGASIGETNTLIFGNSASTSNDDIYGVVSSTCRGKAPRLPLAAVRSGARQCLAFCSASPPA